MSKYLSVKELEKITGFGHNVLSRKDLLDSSKFNQTEFDKWKEEWKKKHGFKYREDEDASDKQRRKKLLLWSNTELKNLTKASRDDILIAGYKPYKQIEYGSAGMTPQIYSELKRQLNRYNSNKYKIRKVVSGFGSGVGGGTFPVFDIYKRVKR